MAEVEQSGLKDPPPRWFFIRQGARDRTSCVAAQGSSVNVAASSAEAAWPAMAWPGKPHGITSTAVTRLPSLREGDRDPPFKWKNCPKKCVAVF